MKKLIIGLIQLDTVWEQPAENKLKIESLLKNNHKKIDLLVLPEMFLTGFSCNQFNISHIDRVSSLNWLESLSINYNLSIIGSLKIIDETGAYRNRLFLTNPISQTQYYDKRHLFPLSDEYKNFTRGSEQKTLKLDDWLISPQICYDLRFPVWSRNTQSYDVMINVANWPSSRNYAWQSLLVARAIENQCYVIGVNRIGTDENGLSYSGGSLIINPLGQIVFDAKNNEGLLSFQISNLDIIEIRRQFPFLNDIDKFILKSDK